MTGMVNKGTTEFMDRDRFFSGMLPTPGKKETSNSAVFFACFFVIFAS